MARSSQDPQIKIMLEQLAGAWDAFKDARRGSVSQKIATYRAYAVVYRVFRQARRKDLAVDVCEAAEKVFGKTNIRKIDSEDKSAMLSVMIKYSLGLDRRERSQLRKAFLSAGKAKIKSDKLVEWLKAQGGLRAAAGYRAERKAKRR